MAAVMSMRPILCSLHKWRCNLALLCASITADVASFAPTNRAKLLWIEAAGSVTLAFPDVAGLINKAHAAHVLVAIDHTWGAGLAYQPFDMAGLAADVAVHALTKYPSGGNDVLLGSVTCRDERLAQKLAHTHAVWGMTAAPDDCANVAKALPTIALRYVAQHNNAFGGFFTAKC